ncbi:DUF1476 domain-containing protein [Rhizobium sp. Root1220]|uniref:DUF1476 domain-containing protein n=1 Tax=Rhizobium sp. Root1220 TaxID=1736432 RepID=UPI0006FF2C15|nr:DUF1476 domain-containing protein [Rhizobium sp. Root1220]KQV79277.1 hypothetical protein ASC90_26535 [Rhizobium sp. Root1220]
MTVDDRKRALESRFAHDQELKFRAEGRRNKLLGHWAAELMGKPDREGYALEVIEADMTQAGDEDVFRKVRGDFDTVGATITDAELREKMTEFLAVAVEQVSRN